MLRLNCGVAAVDDELGAGHERRLIRGEEQHHPRDLFGRAGALHRRHRGNRRKIWLSEYLDHRRFDHPGMNRVHADAFGRVLHGRGLGQQTNRALGRGG